MKSVLSVLAACTLFAAIQDTASAEFRAGAAIVDVTPQQWPVLVNGGMTSRSADKVKAPVTARAIVLDDGRTRLAIVIVDSCMMPRELLDEAKQLAARRTKIRADQMLIAATHSHTAPSSMGCLGTDADEAYVPFLREKLVEAIAAAEANLEPARVGWAVAKAAEFTALRQWVRRPDRLADDPFGNPTVRANMHAGAKWDDAVGEAGPEDPDLSLISLQARDGRPLAVLANFSMHYFGDQALSPDYYGVFRDVLKTRLAGADDGKHPAFVGIMSHGCSGDIWLRDYTRPAGSRHEDWTLDSYANGLAEIALAACQTVAYREDVDLAMAEARLPLKYRVPNKQLLEWAQRIVAEMGDRPPKTTAEVYAREQIILNERQATEIVVQALRIGEIAIATTPNETYALTGWKLKLQSPLAHTMVIELANGGDGYIPPPEQYPLGGYNTWPARSAGLEVMAEPKIVQAGLQLLEQVAGRPRRKYQQTRGSAAAALAAAKPMAYWRLDEFAGPRAVDSSGQNRDAIYEPGVLFFLEGPRSDVYCADGETNRAAHFAGGRIETRLAGLKDRYTLSLWFWNGMPADGRETAGWICSRGHNHGLGPHGDHLGVGGTATAPGRLIFQHGDAHRGTKPLAGRTEIARWTWNHVALVREGQAVRVYLNGQPQPEIEANVPADFPAGFDQWFFGGRCDNDSNWEGRLDEIAVFDRPLSAEEIAKLAPR
ncbi:MAG: hypothetical protein GX575_14430 [Candidatus Anammoximicrobium sp.]|nr:hypothetical protein [Candidatus Anammoximicrobium sp.]